MPPSIIEYAVWIILLTFIVILAAYIYFLKKTINDKKRSRRGPPPAPAAAAAEPEPAADILARAKARFSEGSFRDVPDELKKIPRAGWGEAECSLALRAGLRLNDFSYAAELFKWTESRAGLRDSALLQYLFAIICERAGNAGRAAAIYDKLLRLNGGYQDCEARLRRLRRLPAEDARAMSAYFETTGRGRPGRGQGRQPRGELPALREVAGRFSILSILGVGGSGVVFLAKDKSRDRLVALKRMSQEISRDPGDRALFLAEAKTLSELRHPRIVEFYEAVESGEDVYLVLEYIDWETLQTVLAMRGRLTPGEVIPILTAVAEALVFAHEKKVIHRDLKPGNIVSGPKNFVKVMDFGIARHFDPDTKDTQEVDVVGTPAYMAPEQHAGVTTPLSDIYSFGVTAYALVTGRLPFAGPSALYYSQKMERDYPGLPADLPSGLRELIDRCLMFDPAKRPAGASSLLRLLSQGKSAGFR
jgi:tetratricopeptide (TPR) repeat protein